MGESRNIDAILISSTDVGEDDRILTFLSKETGLLTAAASGARNLKKGKTASLDLFVYSSLFVYRSHKAGKLTRIRSSRVIEPFIKIREDYSRLCAASYMGELVSRTVQEEDPSEAIFKLMLGCLKLLNDGEGVFRSLLIFEIRLLRELGLAPRIDSCLKCGKNITSEAYLEAAAGGTVHVECGHEKNEPPLTAGDLANMRFISEKNLDNLAKLKIREDDARRILLSMNIFSIHHLGFKTRSLKYIMEISPET